MQKPALVILNTMDLKVECSHTGYFQSLRLMCLKPTAYVDICAVIFIVHLYIYVYIVIYTDLTLNSRAWFSESEKAASVVPKKPAKKQTIRSGN